VKKMTMQFAVLVLLLATITACGNFEWFPDNGSTSATTTPSSTAQTATNTTVQKTQMGGAIQGNPLALTTAVTTFAGSTYFADGTGAAARFNSPKGVTSDGTNLYVADTLNNIIRKIVIATGEVSTLAGTSGLSGSADGTGAAARFTSPSWITNDGKNLYVVDSGTIRKIVIASGTVTTLAGTSGLGESVDGIGTAARFHNPHDITLVGTNLYVADTLNNTIRKIVIATGEVTTLAGTAGVKGSTDGTGSAARFVFPNNITSDGTSLYITELGLHIRKVAIATGEVTTMVGQMNFGSSGLTTDGTNLYVADSGTIRKIVIATGEATIVAGAAGQTGNTDGIGTAARFSAASGLVFAGGNMYIVDSENNNIRKMVVATTEVTTLAGSAVKSIDGAGTVARFNNPADVTTDGANLYIVDSNNFTIRKIVIATGVVSTLAGTAGQFGSSDGIGAAARFNFSHGITTDGTNLYVADSGNGTIRKIVIATGAVTTLAGTAQQVGSTDGIGTAARFNSLTGITTDNVNLYVADNGNETIRKIVTATGEVSTLAGTEGQSGATDGTGAAARFNRPLAITTDGTNLYVGESVSGSLRKIVIATGEVTTLRNSDVTWITTDGPNLYFGTGLSVNKFVIATGAVTTLAGISDSLGSANGTGTAARFLNITGGTTDGTSLYVVDGGNNTIRKIQ